jgi:type I restriction enzyme S subunit
MRDGWVEYKFEDVAIAIKGKLPKNKNKDGIGIPYLTASYLRSGKPDYWIQNLDGVITAEDGDCLILWDGAGAGDLFSAHRGVVSSTMAVVTAQDSKILREFLTLFISSKAAYIKETCRGTTVPHVSPDAIANMDLRIPPLLEQKRIVDLISSVDSYIETLQQQLESAKNSKSAYVNTIVSKIFARGKKTKIADIAEVKGGKRLPKGTPWSEEPTDHRYIRATDIKDGIILTENLVYVPDDVWPVISRYVVNQGDVVITIAGTIGQVGVIPASLDGVNLTENAAKIVVDRKLVRSNYLSMLLASSYYQQDIDSKTKKTTQPKLGLNMINSIEIPLPELDEQDEIFSVVSQIDTLIASTSDLIMQTITLRTGLLSNLLSGEHEIPASYDRLIGAA